MNETSAYQSICLQDEAAKLLKRILPSCLAAHLLGVELDLAENQFGFRENVDRRCDTSRPVPLGLGRLPSPDCVVVSLYIVFN